MRDMLKNSMVWYVIVRCIKCFDEIYHSSVLYRIIERISEVFANSHIGKLGNTYREQSPVFLDSRFHKVSEAVFSFFKQIVGVLFVPVRSFRVWISGSSKILAGISGILLVIAAGVVDIKLALIVAMGIIGIIFVLTDYERATYVLALYAVLDSAFRTYLSGIASVWDEMFLIGLCLLWVLKWCTRRKEKALKTSPFDSCVIIFIGVMLVLFFVSPRTGISFEGFRAIVQNMFWYFVVFQLLKNEKGVRNLSIVFVALVGILSVHGVYQYIIGVEMPSTWISSSEAGIRTRVYSIFTSPNIFGSLIVLAFPICVSVFLISKGIRAKLLSGMALMFMAASLAFTYSRGAWIGIACAVGIYVLFKDRRLLIPAVIGGLMILVLVPSIGDRILYMLSPEYMESSMKAGRMIRWLTGFQIWKEHPWFGLGLGSFGGSVAANHGLSAIVGGKIVPTFYMDNYYMKIATETGIVGITAFLWLMWQVFSISLKTVSIVKDKASKELGTGIMAGLLGVIIHNCVENVFEVPMMGAMFWMFVAAMAQLWYSNYCKAEEEKSEV